ncbi:ergothioneine biosynthesis PLP-dependent enzyme EgtE [Mycobacterium sp. EPa45]|uniref:ergothioneine biosynthesis PLP-dependent enzyme EgtE n=1 Tax=Mycobacterium sp. EPa45 TaxID=1545728 RepID=UPI0006427E07|nr:ergothioneine biosynthesis PLP-dependent enzyme EgtE [Mycobacterium sp. EPa45]AKK29778.1 pyridoxal-5'-phosphate-dependent protein [Mycobacterium sp. EPa45]
MSARDALADSWREARLPAAGVHLDSAACSRQSLAAIDAAAAHARHESEVGGYIAAEAAAPVLDAGRAGIAALTGMSSADVIFTTGSGNALQLLLGVWPMERTVACLPGEYGPNLAEFAARDFTRQALPVDSLGRVDPDAARTMLVETPPAMVHLTAVASHRGVVQPVAAVARVCREIGVPLIVDAAQALGHVDCAVDADAVYSSSRKWLAGPRGVGVLAVRPALADLLQSPPWAGAMSALQCLELGEANVAARVGFSVAVGQHLAAGPEKVRQRLTALGQQARTILSEIPGWRVVEPADAPTAITTLEPTEGADPVRVRARLIDEYGIVTTAAGVERAPMELTTPVLRVSPHVDATADDLETLVTALRAVT